MKKPSLKQFISGSLAATFLLESCVKDNIYYMDDSVVNINEHHAGQLKNIPSTLLNIQLSSDDRLYFDFISQLGTDILADRTTASLFASNPQAYANSKGYSNLIVSLDDDLIKMITALGDIDIYNAVQSGDFESFLTICKNKGITTGFDINDSERIKNLISSNPELLHLLNIDDPNRTSIVAFAFAIAVGACVAVWAFAVTHLAVFNAVGGATVLALAAAAVGTWVTITWGHSLINTNPMIVQIWALSGGSPNDTYIMLTEYEKAQLEEFISILEHEFPNDFVGVDKEALKQLLVMNLKQQTSY